MDTVSEFSERFPDVPVIVCSGYSDHQVMSDPAAYGFDGSISKPFRADDLVRLLSEVKNN